MKTILDFGSGFSPMRSLNYNCFTEIIRLEHAISNIWILGIAYRSHIIFNISIKIEDDIFIGMNHGRKEINISIKE